MNKVPEYKSEFKIPNDITSTSKRVSVYKKLSILDRIKFFLGMKLLFGIRDFNDKEFDNIIKANFS